MLERQSDIETETKRHPANACQENQQTIESHFLRKPIESQTIPLSPEEQTKLDTAFLHETFLAANCKLLRESLISYKRMTNFICRGANINKLYQGQNSSHIESGFTPIHLASYFYNADLIKFLLINGADDTIKVTGNINFDRSYEWHGIKCNMILMSYILHCEQTPRQLYGRSSDHAHSPSYDDLFESAKEIRGTHEKKNYLEKQIISLLMIENDKHNKGIPISENINESFLTIFSFLTQYISLQNVTNPRENSFAQSVKLRFFKGVASEEKEENTPCTPHKKIESAINCPIDDYFTPKPY